MEILTIWKIDILSKASKLKYDIIQRVSGFGLIKKTPKTIINSSTAFNISKHVQSIVIYILKVLGEALGHVDGEDGVLVKVYDDIQTELR